MSAEWGEAEAPKLTPTDDLRELFEACYDDPLLFFEQVLRIKLRAWQRDVLTRIRDRRQAGENHTKLHIRTCHQSGKTFTSGGLVLWWGSTRPGSRVLTTAPTWKGVEDLLWNEIHKLYEQGLLAQMKLGRMLDVKWDMGRGWFATGAASDKPANLEGQGSEIAAARIVDEAKTVPDAVYVATQGMLSSPETLDVWISTPSIRSGKFYERDMDGGEKVIRVVVTIDDLIRDNVPGKVTWKEEALVEYGGESSFEYQSRANAAYIDNAEGAVFPFSWIERAMMTDEERTNAGLEVWHVSGQETLGYDVAGSVDGDENATASSCGPDALLRYEIKHLDHWHERDTQKSKDRVIETVLARRARCARVDVQGLGKGVSDAIVRELYERHLNFFVEEYRSADSPGEPNLPETTDPGNPKNRFINKKAENTWGVRLMAEQDRLRLPKSPTLRKQMAALKYEVRNGKIRIVDPPDSPDWWDAVLMAIGGVYHKLSVDDIGGGGANVWGPQKEHLAWTQRV